MKKRVVSLLLCLIMALSLIPTTAFAVGTSSQDDGISLTSIVQPDDQKKYYTYKFYHGEDLISTQIVKEGDTLYQPATPTTEEGKVFTGWYDKAGKLFTSFGTVGTIAENKTIKLTAKIEDGYYVYFKDNTGRIIATETGTTGQTIPFEDVSFAVGTDEAITGWYTDSTLTNKVTSVTIENSNITLYAKVEKGYWITFESNGGSYVAPAFYANGKTAAAPDKPTKSGYTFDDWYTDEGLTDVANFASITASTTLYAKWTAANKTNYTVIHWQENVDDDKFSFMESETKTGITGELTKATAKKSYDGFNVRGIEQKTIAGDGSTIVNVYYERNVYTINFWPTNGSTTLICVKKEHTHSWWNGCYNWRGNLTCTKEEHTHDSSCYETRALYTITAKYGAYIGDQWPTHNGSSTWATKKNGNTYQCNIDTMPLGGASFYGPKSDWGSETAYYYVEVLPGESGTYLNGVTYKLHHKDTSPGTGYYVSKEDKYPITGFTYSDGTQNGGNYDNAKFYYTRNSYDIVFLNNGTTEKTVSRKFEQSIAVAGYTPTAPTSKEGYQFDGWYDNELCEGNAYDFTGKTMPAQNITLYAKWVAPTYTVTVYDQDDNKLGEIIVSKGDTVTDKLSMLEANLKSTLETGDSFLGWTINRGLPFNPGTKITTNYELYAKVGNSTGYSVTYNANGGTGSMTDNEKYAKGAKATVKSNSFRNGDMVFLGWNTKADGTGTTYYPNSTVEITDNVTLYARWGDKASTVSVTYHSNFAPDQTKTVKDIANNSQIKVADYTTLDLPARTGYTFTGWNTQADGKGTSFAADASARVDNLGSDNVLYAQWKQLTGTLTINKVLKGLNPTDFEDGFAFEIKDASGKVVATVEKVFPGMATPATVTLTPGTYTIVEKNADKDGYDLTTEYDKETFTVEAGKNVIVTVTNTYEKITGTVTIDKVLKGLNATDFEDGFAFDIKDASGKVVATVEKVFPGMAQPATVTLVPGTYTIVEKNADKDGYDLTTEYDKETFTVEAGKNVIVTVTNTYEKITGTVTIDKVLKGLNATDFEDGFAFDIKDASGKVVATVEKVFPGMAQPATVTLVPGTYTIVEKSADVKDYDLTTEYDKETFTVEAGKNVIVTVTNTYTKKVTPPPAEYTLSVDIQKNIELKRSSSRKPGKASFTFEAYLVDEKGNETILDTVTIDTKGIKSADGTLTFTLTEDDLSVTGHGTVYVREVKGSTRGWTYDDTVYALGVELLDGKLNIISVDTKRIDKPATLEFTNVYYKRSTTTGGGDKPIQSVKTGDMGIAMYAMTSLLSLGGAALVIKKRKEEK